MRLDFNVLWVDDQPKSVESVRNSVGLKLRKHGFNLKDFPVSSADEASKKLGASVFADEMDLVLVDYDLGKKQTGGDRALKIVRRAIEHKDIIFYSALSVKALNELVYQEGVQGVFCCNRTELVETILGLFQSLTKKVLDLDHMRGIVMGATSDIDHVVLDSLVLLAKLLNHQQTKRWEKKATKRLDEKLQVLSAKVSSAEKKAVIELCADVDLLTSTDRLRLLVNALQFLGTDHDSHRADVSRYLQEVVPKRNKLGHAAMKFINGERTLAALNETALLAMLPNLLEHRETFYALRAVLESKLGDAA